MLTKSTRTFRPKLNIEFNVNKKLRGLLGQKLRLGT